MKGEDVVSRVVVLCVLVVGGAGQARAESCQDAVAGSQLVVARTERIEGGTRCYVRHKDGGDESLHTIVWDQPTAGVDQKHGCEVNEPFLLQLWERNLEARGRAAQASSTKKDHASRTFATAAVFDETCRHIDTVDGAFIGAKDLHAERQVMAKLVTDKKLNAGYSLVWMIDQEPCRKPDKEPKEGYCTLALKDFATKYKVASRVFLVTKMKGSKKDEHEVGSAKVFATTAYAHRNDDAKTRAKYWPAKGSYMELSEFRVTP